MTTPNITTLQYTVPANGTVAIFRQSEMLTCLEADGQFGVKIDHGPQFDLEAGLGVTFDQAFTQIELINEGATPNTIKLALGKGNIRDARLVLSGSIDSAEIMPDTLTTGGAVSAANGATTALAAANLSRREVMAVVDATAGGTVYLGGAAGAAAGEGIPVAPGQSVTLQTTAALYARNDTGDAVNIWIAEVERS